MANVNDRDIKDSDGQNSESVLSDGEPDSIYYQFWDALEKNDVKIFKSLIDEEIPDHFTGNYEVFFKIYKYQEISCFMKMCSTKGNKDNNIDSFIRYFFFVLEKTNNFKDIKKKYILGKFEFLEMAAESENFGCFWRLCQINGLSNIKLLEVIRLIDNKLYSITEKEKILKIQHTIRSLIMSRKDLHKSEWNYLFDINKNKYSHYTADVLVEFLLDIELEKSIKDSFMLKISKETDLIIKLFKHVQNLDEDSFEKDIKKIPSYKKAEFSKFFRLDKKFYTLFQLACEKGLKRVTDILLTTGCDPNAETKYNEKSMTLAFLNCHTNILKVLMSNKYRLKVKYNKHILISMLKNLIHKKLLKENNITEYNDCMSILKTDKRANVAYVCSFLLKQALKMNHESSILFLFRHGASVNIIDKSLDGITKNEFILENLPLKVLKSHLDDSMWIEARDSRPEHIEINFSFMKPLMLAEDESLNKVKKDNPKNSKGNIFPSDNADENQPLIPTQNVNLTEIVVDSIKSEKSQFKGEEIDVESSNENNRNIKNKNLCGKGKNSKIMSSSEDNPSEDNQNTIPLIGNKNLIEIDKRGKNTIEFEKEVKIRRNNQLPKNGNEEQSNMTNTNENNSLELEEITKNVTCDSVSGYQTKTNSLKPDNKSSEKQDNIDTATSSSKELKANKNNSSDPKIKKNNAQKEVKDDTQDQLLIKEPSEKMLSEIDILLRISKIRRLRPIIQHPVIQSFIYLKWQKARWLFWLNFFCFAIFHVILMVHVYLDSPDENFCVVSVLLLISLAFLICRELIQFYSHPLFYITSYENYLEIFTFTITLIMICSWNNYVLRVYLGVIALFLASFELVVLMAKFSMFSIYYTMLKSVIWNFFKFIGTFFIIFFCFGLIFYKLFHENENKTGKKVEIKKHPDNATENENYNFFLSLDRTVFKTIVMFTGELEASLFNFDNFPGISHVMFGLFIIIVTIVLYNFLNGLAISDIQAIRNDAEIVSLIHRIEVLSYLENVIFGVKLLDNPSNKVCDILHHLKSRKYSYFVKTTPHFPWFAEIISLFPDIYPYRTIKVSLKNVTKSYLNCFKSCMSCFSTDKSFLNFFTLDKEVIELIESKIKERLEKKMEYEQKINMEMRLTKIEECLLKHDIKFSDILKILQDKSKKIKIATKTCKKGRKFKHRNEKKQSNDKTKPSHTGPMTTKE